MTTNSEARKRMEERSEAGRVNLGVIEISEALLLAIWDDDEAMASVMRQVVEANRGNNPAPPVRHFPDVLPVTIPLTQEDAESVVRALPDPDPKWLFGRIAIECQRRLDEIRKTDEDT